MKSKNLTYITYQSFPAQTANSLQTISNIRHLKKIGINVKLFFPLREVSSNSSINELQDFYNFQESFDVTGIEHKYPHGKFKYFKKLWFHISHFLWSQKYIKLLFKNNKNEQFFTRSEWIAYFLSKYDLEVIFEVHQPSFVRDLIIKKIKKRKNVKFIFLNNLLKDYYFPVSNYKVLPNAVEIPKNFSMVNKKKKNQIIFVGNISRFNKSRGLEEIIGWFMNKDLEKNFSLEIIGGTEKEVTNLRSYISKNKLSKTINVTAWLGRSELHHKLSVASFGLLLNTSKNKHSFYYTSPLKYFEYLKYGLSVVAIDFPSHRNLPFNQYINFFKEGDESSFVSAFFNNVENKKLNNKELHEISLQKRAEEILNLINQN